MPAPIHLSPLQFRALGHGMIDWIADYLEGVEARSVSPSVRPGDIAAMLPADPPARGEDWGAILADIDRVVMPGITHWQSPNFFGYFPANGSYPAILGDLLSAGLGVNGMMWATSPAATEIETRVMDWLGRMVGLPESFLSEPREGAKVAESGLRGGGVIQATASEATLVALVAARARIMRASGTRERLDEKESNLLMYASNQAHSSVVKAAKIAGIGEKTGTGEHRCVRQIDVDADFAMNPEQLATAIDTARDQGHIPFFVVATVGTTGSTAIDRLDKLGPICRERNLWLHVDAAMAGAACICPEHRWMLHGIEHPDVQEADSLSDPRKDVRGRFTLILANPPFKGSVDMDVVAEDLLNMVGLARQPKKKKMQTLPLENASLAEEKKAPGAKTELLFLAQILGALKVGGRAAVIVPDGVLFGSSRAHVAIRKKLVEEQLLEGIVSMPAGVFKLYAGVSTAVILFARSDAGGTDKVWFYDMTADGYSLDDKRQQVAENDIPDVIRRWRGRDEAQDTERTAKAFFVPKAEIVGEGYDLSINRYNKVEHKAVTHEAPSVLLERLMDLEKQIQSGLEELRGLVG